MLFIQNDFGECVGSLGAEIKNEGTGTDAAD